ncbi:MAG: WG repeat-containing protein [Candidatus Pedobacter colombiensis]|uniref:WG repeat-containing protein n=1 Tax=Candidatus Pedobacter colombiensis TaxID=3121371 RepID=A0AAJ5WBB3_9SPHI|nr:WG repeat-containing protein [Pedobacter sp.]WEK20516.1 MAG: WG repeat-containing protein [Pedobacter sp.]
MRNKLFYWSLLFLITFQGYSQQKISGRFKPFAKLFIATDTNILVKPSVNGKFAFMIKSKDLKHSKTSRVGFIDSAGRVIVEPKYINCSNFDDGYALVQDTSYNIGVIDTNGKTVIKMIYANISRCKNGLLMILKDGKFGLIKINGTVVLEPNKYDSFSNDERRYVKCMVLPNPYFWELLDFDRNEIHFDEYLGVRYGGKWAVIDKNGIEIISTKYEGIGTFENGVATAEIGKKYGVIDAKGNLLVTAKYEFVMLTPYNFVKVLAKNKLGIVSLQNKTLVPPKYSSISPYDENHFLVEDDKGLGVVDSKNKTIIPIKDQQIKRFGIGYMISPNFEGGWAFFDEKGKQKTAYLRGWFDSPVWYKDYAHGFMIYNEKEKKNKSYKELLVYNNFTPQARIFGYQRAGKWGLLDTTGVEITKPLYDKLEFQFFKKNANSDANNLIKAMVNKKWGLIDRNGNKMLDFEYDELSNRYSGLSLAKKNGKYGLLSKDIKLITPIKYDEITLQDGDFRIEKFILVRINKKTGLINSKGNEIIPVKYDYVNSFFLNGFSVVGIGKKMGLFDLNGKMVFPVIYDSITVNEDGFHTVLKDGFWGVINRSHDVILPIVYGQVLRIYDQNSLRDAALTTKRAKYCVNYNGKEGLLDSTGKIVVPFLYDTIIRIADNSIIASKGGYVGVIDWEGNIIVPFIYLTIEDLGRFYKVCINGKYGSIDKNGKHIIKPVYDQMDYLYGGFLVVTKDDKQGVFNIKGEEIVKPIYDSCKPCGKTNIIVHKSEKAGLLDDKGALIYPCIYKEIECVNGTIVIKKFEEIKTGNRK